MTPSEILLKAADLLEHPGAWTQKTLARTSTGKMTGPEQNDATCWCTLGALLKVVTDEGIHGIGPARRMIETTINCPNVANWNDDPTRTQAEVVETLRKAAAA